MSSSHYDFISHRGFRLSYTVYGEGDPVVCLHGLNMNARMFAGRSWKELLKDKKIIALDLPGHGRSDFIPDADMEEISRLITLTTDQLGLENFELCGFCLGGVFALDYAIRNQEKVSKLYLIETMIFMPWWLNLCSSALFRILYKRISQNSFCLALLGLLPPLKGLAKIQSIRPTWDIWDHEVNSFYIEMMKDYQKIDHIQRSTHLTCKTELIFSDNSFQNIQKTNQALHASLKNSTLNRLPNHGHFTMMF